MATLEGPIHQFIEIMDLVQTRQENGEMILRSGSSHVSLYFKGGSLIHATDGVQEGDHLVYTAAGWENGTFEFFSGPIQETRRTIDEAQSMMLLETFKLMKGGKPPGETNGPPGEAFTGNLHRLVLPAGNVLHNRLKASYLDLPGLLDDLARSTFSGAVEVQNWPQEGLILFHQGQISDHYFYDGQMQVEVGEPGKGRVLELAGRRDSEITVRELADSFVASFSSLIYGKAVHEGLDGRVIKIRSLVDSLLAAGFNGAVNIRIPDSFVEGFVFIFEGQNLGAYYRQGNDLRKGVGKVFKMVNEPGAGIWVFETPTLGESVVPAKVRPVITPNQELLVEAVRRCVRSLTEVTGPKKVIQYFSKALDLAGREYPWLRGLELTADGSVNDSRLELKGLSVDETVSGFVTLLDGCLQQGRATFGDKMIQKGIDKHFSRLLPELLDMGFPPNWPNHK